MCHHFRIVYECNHYAWGAMAQACELQESFEESKTDEGCAVMWSHGTNTFKVKGLCPKCAGKKEKEDAKYSEVKSKIKDLKSEAKVLLDDITRILERCNVLGVRQDSETALPSDGSGSAKSEGWICAATLSDESEMLAPERFEPAEEVQSDLATIEKTVSAQGGCDVF